MFLFLLPRRADDRVARVQRSFETEMPGQFTVKDIKTEVFTNVGAPPHYVETKSAVPTSRPRSRGMTCRRRAWNEGPLLCHQGFFRPVPCAVRQSGNVSGSRGYLIKMGLAATLL